MARTSQTSPKGSTAVPQRLDTFHLFSLLPAEIRLEIWRLSLPESRILPIRCEASTPPNLDATYIGSRYELCMSTAAIPTTLHACHESRMEALKSYRLCFGLNKGQDRVFFRSATDILYFGPRDGYLQAELQLSSFLTLSPKEHLADIRCIALNDSVFEVNGCACGMPGMLMIFSTLQQAKKYLPALEEVIFVQRDKKPVYSQELAFAEPLVTDLAFAKRIKMAIERLEEVGDGWVPSWKFMNIAAAPGGAVQAEEGKDILVSDESHHGAHKRQTTATATAPTTVVAASEADEADKGLTAWFAARYKCDWRET